MAKQVRVEITRIIGYLFANPFRLDEYLILGYQFDFGELRGNSEYSEYEPQ